MLYCSVLSLLLIQPLWSWYSFRLNMITLLPYVFNLIQFDICRFLNGPMMMVASLSARTYQKLDPNKSNGCMILIILIWLDAPNAFYCLHFLYNMLADDIPVAGGCISINLLFFNWFHYITILLTKLVDYGCVVLMILIQSDTPNAFYCFHSLSNISVDDVMDRDLNQKWFAGHFGLFITPLTKLGDYCTLSAHTITTFQYINPIT